MAGKRKQCLNVRNYPVFQIWNDVALNRRPMIMTMTTVKDI